MKKMLVQGLDDWESEVIPVGNDALGVFVERP